MPRLTELSCDPKELNILALAFVGDGVYDLIVRERLACSGNLRVKELNSRKVALVRCQAQAQTAARMEPHLTPEEADVLRRGRNAHVSHHAPKNADIADYHMATALECLIGYLYLSDRVDRITELLELAEEKP